MRKRFSVSMTMVAIAAAAGCVLISAPMTTASAQAPTASGATPAPSPRTAWGEPDLQGIWTDETDTPLQRSPKYANQEFFTEAQRAELDKERAALLGRDKRGERGTELDVAGAYNDQAHRRAHVADCGSAQWPDSAADAGGRDNCRSRPGFSSCPVAIDRNVQEQVGGM